MAHRTQQRPVDTCFNRPRRAVGAMGHASRRRAGGFTLVEILLALGIFLIGMAAVASLFPVAAILQRETASDVYAGHAEASAQAFIKSKTFTYIAGDNSTDLSFYHPSGASTKHTLEPFVSFFDMPQRAYPSSQLTGINRDDVANCDFFWVPFIQDLNGDGSDPNWTVRVFVLQGDSKVNYNIATGGGISAIANPSDLARFPKVVSTGCSVADDYTLTVNYANHGLESGDKVMDNNGTDYTISLVQGTSLTMTSPILRSPQDPTALWFAPSQGSINGSPTKAILTIAEGAQELQVSP